MPRRQSLAAWVRRNVVVTDGPQAGRRIVLEPWQRQVLDAIDRERKTTFAQMMASQIGKAAITLPVGIRAAVDGRGGLMASATDHGVKDLRRRLDRLIESSPGIGEHFPAVRSGPGARSSSACRETTAAGWLAMATAGSASQLSSRTAQVAGADEISRWPRTVRSGEGAPLQLLEARQQDWGDDAVLVAISSPVSKGDGIELLYRDGDRRRLEYPCPTCGDRTHFAWEQVTGREQGETPMIACARCGELHDERARRRMLRRGQWVAQRSDATNEDCASFHASRLDSARASLGQVVKAWRKARLRVERGDPRALATFTNLVLGRCADSGAADVDKLYELRERTFRLDGLAQCTAGVDVQDDRLVHVLAGWSAGNRDCWILDHGETIGDPREADVWSALASNLARPFGGLPASVVSVDAGFLTSHVQRECSRRRWWIPTVGRVGQMPIARRMGSSGIAVLGKNDAAATWSGMVAAGRVHLPREITRQQIAELCAAEALTAEGGALRWKPIDHRPNHRWDAGLLALHGRTFRPLGNAPRRLRLVAV